jgi:hypothetical protein
LRARPNTPQPIKSLELFLQLDHDAGHAVGAERVLVAGLRGGEQVQRVDPLVADQSLGQLGVALDDVDEVVDDPPLRPHHEIQVAQADVEIDHHDLLPALRQRGAKGGGRRGLADASLAGRHHQHLSRAREDVRPS